MKTPSLFLLPFHQRGLSLMLPVVLLTGCSTAHETKLANCKQSRFTFHFRCPSGHHYRMLLGVPCKGDCEKLIPAPPTFEGQIKVKEGAKLIYEFPVSSETAGRCNWLERKNHYGYLLTWGETDKLKERLRGRHKYDVFVTFAEVPPQDASLWLSWVTP